MLPDRSSDPSLRPAQAARAVAGPLFLVGALLVVLPALDLLLNVWPLQPGDFRWRFGVVGLLANFLLTPLLGVALLSGTAALAAAPTARRVVGAVNVAGAVLLALALGLFLLDLVQLRPTLRPEALPSFDVANARAMLKLALGAAALLWLGAAGLRRAPEPARATPRAAAPVRAGVLAG